MLISANAQAVAALLSELAEKISFCRRSRRRRDRAAVASGWNDVTPA